MVTQISAQARAAQLKVGDYISGSGTNTKPGVVVEKKEDGTVLVDTDPAVVSEYHRYANTSGLTPEQKHQFNAIMDEINQTEDSVSQLELIDAKIAELRQDPANKDLAQVLRNQQSKLIRKSGELPRLYTERADKVA
jgi:hypothetical protein